MLDVRSKTLKGVCMKTISLVFVTALSLAAAGCKKTGADCDKAIAKSMELSKVEMAKMPGNDAKTMQKMKNIGLQHCKDDKWPESALSCMTEAKTETDSQACYGKLSQDQQDKMNKAAMDAVMPAGGATTAGSGDATGSAGSAAAPK